MKNLWTALESAWRAGLKQYRKVRTLQRKAALVDPLKEMS